jgi:hypothetical protein
MSKVVAIMSMSLDGFVADRNDGVAEVFDWYASSGDVEFETGGADPMTFGEGQRSPMGALGHAPDAGGALGRSRRRRIGRRVHVAGPSRSAAAHARLLLLGVSRARIPAGRADGPVKGGAARCRHAARAVRSRGGSAGGAERVGGQRSRRRTDRVVSANGAHCVGALALTGAGVRHRYAAAPTYSSNVSRSPG